MHFVELKGADSETFYREQVTLPAGTFIGVWARREGREILVGTYLGPDARARYEEWAVSTKATVRDVATKTLRQVTDAYFAGQKDAFSKLTLGFLGGTPFQREVWKTLTRIPFGKTHSYAELAARIGRAKSARPTGQAVGANPIPLVIPCHRVVGSQGAMTGFGCGLPVKRVLLQVEGWQIDRSDRLVKH